MKSRIPQALAIAFLGIGAANAQFVDEPTAATLKADGPDAQLANELVQALNADASLKGSKMVVQPETRDTSSLVYITGVTRTEDQARRVSEIVAAHAGDAKVVNLLQPDHLTMKPQNTQ